MSAPIGYLVARHEVECVDCHRPAEWPGFEDWEAPEPLFYGTAADVPHQCRRCWALVPHALTDKGLDYVRGRLTSGKGHPDVLAQWFDAYGDVLGIDHWNRSRADAGGHAEIANVVVKPMGDTYWFPHEDGMTLNDVGLTVHWSPYGTQMSWATRPFTPGDRWTSGFRSVQYPGRDYAHNRRDAARVARELFTTSYVCLQREHDTCTGRMADPAQWPEAYACQCSCHQAARP
jgi:hypothetical protein